MRLLATPKEQLGFVPSELPQMDMLDGQPFADIQLVRRGTAHGTGSHVLRVRMDDGFGHPEAQPQQH